MSDRLELYLANETRTLALGAALGRLARAGDVIALQGELGAGKTALSRGFIRTLCGQQTDVPSPTYTLVQTYEAPGFQVFHFDLYRIETPDELTELGWDETEGGVTLVEWPGHAGSRLPDWRLDVTLTPEGDGRIAALEPRGEDWQTRLNGFRL